MTHPAIYDTISNTWFYLSCHQIHICTSYGELEQSCKDEKFVSGNTGDHFCIGKMIPQNLSVPLYMSVCLSASVWGARTKLQRQKGCLW